jgi:predicted PurR-regulated permease PerM
MQQEPTPKPLIALEAAAPNPQQIDVVKAAATLLSAAIVIAALYYGRDILIPLACAFLISFALSPPVAWLVRLGLPRILSIVLVMAMLLASLAGLGLVLASQLRSLSQDLPSYQSTMRAKLSALKAELKAPGMFDGALETIESVQKEVKEAAPAEVTPDAPQRVEVVSPPRDPFETTLEWLGRSLEPLATAGIVFVFVFLALLDRNDLRDRLLRMLGGNLHRSTDAVEEAGKRISKYLLMQLIINVSYGVPMALGLWLIGVPGALLWGTVAAVMRFVPYVGPMLSAIFPIGLAFAVDPGWSMVLWTVALILFLELVSNNIVEPLLYGTSTGLSAMSLIAAATFWTALWGPMGLILATPLTVCLLVIGRNIPQLQFLDTLLGSMPPLDLPTRIYQRLLADDADEAIEIATTEIDKSSPREFYNDVGLPVLRLASEDYLRNATAEHRLRVANGMDALLDDLRDEYPAAGLPSDSKPRVLCIGGKWEVDTIAAEMLSHALALDGIPAGFRPAIAVSAASIAKLDLAGADVVCLSYFASSPATPARHFCRRLRRRWPDLRIVLALWNAPDELLADNAHEALGADQVVTSIDEALGRIHRMIAPEQAEEAQKAEVPENDEERAAALRATGVLTGSAREDLDALATRAAEVFNVGFAVISAIDETDEYIVGQSKDLPGNRTEGGDMLVIPREEAACNHLLADAETLVVPDAERDPRFADNPTIKRWNARFYAGTPLRSADGFVFGALCLLDAEPHTLDEREVELLNTMAADVVAIIAGDDAASSSPGAPTPPATATVGQQVPE